MRKTLAHSAHIDHESSDLSIDGVKLPWYLAVPGPEVEKHSDVPVLMVTVTFLIDGVVTVRVGGDVGVLDPVLGDVGECARRTVREALVREFPWLEV